MSVSVMERPRAFPTTVGFRVQGGFDLPSQPASPCTPTLAFSTCLTQPKQLSSLSPANQQHFSDKAGLQSGLLLQRSGCSQHAPCSSSFSFSASGPRPPALGLLLSDSQPNGMSESPGAVGYKGLLEYSENSGCSGVLGPSAQTSEDLDRLLNRDCKIEICCTAHTSPVVRRLVKSVIRGVRACQEPEKAADGMGGTYFFANEAGKKAAILKPCDEEPLAPNNPKGYVGRQLGDPGWKPTVRVGEAAIREVAAYLLDHDGWARVPTSVLVRARHPVFCYQASRALGADGNSNLSSPLTSSGGATASSDSSAACTSPISLDSPLPMKLGSLQEFVTHECDTSEMGPGRFSVRDVHRIGILDVRLFNTDRHAGNMLVRTQRTASTTDLRRMVTPDGMYELIPIDHGFCLPETLEAPYFEWLHWPQTMLPFSEEELQYIRELDVEKDKSILRQELPILRPECLRVLEVCTTLLKDCAAAGLTLFDIANVMTRPFVESDEEPSELERLCAYARECVEFTKEMTAQCGEDESDSGSEPAEDCGLEELVVTGYEQIAARHMSRKIPSIKEEDMLFDWEEAANGLHISGTRHGVGATATLGSMEVTSPETYSPSSSVSGSEHMGMAAMASASSSGPLSQGEVATAEAVTPRAVPMASSVHVTEGFLWRKLKNQQAAIKRVTAAKGGVMTCPKRGRMAPQVYPPPVSTFSPERMRSCFSNMTAEQWGQFMLVVKEQIQGALESGRWTQPAADLASGMALSCPRF